MHKIDPIDKNPLVIIVTLLTIYQELLPSIIDVGLITPCELFKTLCTGTAVAEYNDILFKASGEMFGFIQANFNKKTCLLDEDSKEVKAWKKMKLYKQGYLVTAYTYIFPPSDISPPTERAPVEKLVCCNALGIQSLDALDWLNIHKHRWRYSELLHNNIMEEVKQLMLCLFGK